MNIYFIMSWLLDIAFYMHNIPAWYISSLVRFFDCEEMEKKSKLAVGALYP